MTTDATATKGNCWQLAQTPNSLMYVTNVHINYAFAGTN